MRIPHDFSRFSLRKTALLLTAFLAVESPVRAETDLIANDKFSDSGSSWTAQAPPSATVNMTVEQIDDEPVLTVDVQKGPEEGVDDVRIFRVFGDIEQGREYKVSFKAKADEATTIIPFSYPQDSGARVLWRVETRLEPDWKDYQYTFKGRATESGCVLGFSHLGKLHNKYYFKDIVLSVAD